MLRLGLAACASALMLTLEGFTFTIGNPVASQDFHMKAASFVFRTEGSADPGKAQVAASAEGLVKGARRSVSLKVAPSSRPGVYAVFQNWPAEGDWVATLKGTCASATAGAIVPFGPKGFIRDSSKFFSRPATDAEVEASLTALTQGGNK
jgi:hypothetical protein